MEQVKKSGMPPGPRAGFAMCVHKRRALLFGGVVDMEVDGQLLVFYLIYFVTDFLCVFFFLIKLIELNLVLFITKAEKIN